MCTCSSHAPMHPCTEAPSLHSIFPMCASVCCATLRVCPPLLCLSVCLVTLWVGGWCMCTFKPRVHIWLILVRSNPPLKSAGDFPQIVSNRINSVKPMNVGFLSSFFVFSIAGFWSILSNRIFRLTISKGQIFSLLLAIIVQLD